MKTFKMILIDEEIELRTEDDELEIPAFLRRQKKLMVFKK